VVLELEKDKKERKKTREKGWLRVGCET